MKSSSRRRVCVVVNSRANYGRIKSAMQAIKHHPQLELQIVTGASALLFRFGRVVDVLRADGFEPDATVYSIVEGENPTTMAKSTGLAIIELATIFENLKPDFVLTVADRFETIGTAIAASYMNIPLVHTQGGELSGSIDESVRHAITKLSNIHFPATEQAGRVVRSLGEDPDTIFVTGCPAIDLVANLDLSLAEDTFQRYLGTGRPVDRTKPYLVVLQHPVTTEYGKGFEQIDQTLQAITKIGAQAVWLWPNVDAGSDDISKRLRMFSNANPNASIAFYRNFSPEDYARLINNSACIVGNSSSGIRECAFLGVPAVNIGTRQNNREHGPNVVHVPYSADAIERAVRKQLDAGRYPSSDLFGRGDAGEKMAEILAGISIPTTQKSFAA